MASILSGLNVLSQLCSIFLGTVTYILRLAIFWLIDSSLTSVLVSLSALISCADRYVLLSEGKKHEITYHRYCCLCTVIVLSYHDDVIKLKYFPRYWTFCREFTGDQWIPSKKASDANIWCFLWFAHLKSQHLFAPFLRICQHKTYTLGTGFHNGLNPIWTHNELEQSKMSIVHGLWCWVRCCVFHINLIIFLIIWILSSEMITHAHIHGACSNMVR